MPKIMKKIILLILLSILTTVNCVIFSQDWEWAKANKNYDDYYYSESRYIGIDKYGNTYAAGNFSDVFHIDSIIVYSSFYENVYLAKFNPAGKCLWIKVIQGTDYSYIYDLEVDEDGNSYISGYYYYSLIVDTVILFNDNYESAEFFIKFDSNGNVKWANKLNYIYQSDIELDTDGNPYIFCEDSYYDLYINDTLVTIGDYYNLIKFNKQGNFIEVVDLSNSYIMYNLRADITTSGKYAICYYDDSYYERKVSLYEDDTELWTNILDAEIEINTIISDSDENIYISGNYYYGIYIDGNYIPNSGNRDGIIIKYNNQGEFVWYKQIVGYDYYYYYNNKNISISNDSILFITGAFNNYLKIDSTEYYVYNSSLYVAKMTTDGEMRWVHFSDSDHRTYPASITSNSDNEAIITGYFDNYLKLGRFEFTNNSDNVFFIAKVNNKPRMPVKIYGDSIICKGINEYYVDSADNVSYEWHLSDVGIIENKLSKLTYYFNDTGNYKLTVIPYNDKLKGDSLSILISVKEVPQKPVIIGDTSTCLGTEAYNVESNSDYSYKWELDDGGTLFVINNTALVDWTYVGDYQLSLMTSNFCGSSEKAIRNIEVNELPVQPGQITGDQDVCIGTYSYSAPSISGITYSWTMSSGGSLFSNGNQVTVNWTTAGNHVLSVVPNNSCGTGPARTLAVSVSETPDQPSTIFGDNEVCEGVEIYTIIEKADEEYKWTISGGGVLDYEGGRAEVDWINPGTYKISVAPENQCGTGQVREELIEVYGIPEKPDTVYGIKNVCQGIQTYSVDKLINVNYTWTLSGGGILTPTKNMATVEWTDSGTFSLTVTPYNICGVGSSKTIVVYVKGTVDQITEIVGNSDVCSGEEIYEVNDIPGMTYIWELMSGGSLIPEDTNVISVTWTTKGEHILSLVTSDGCNQSKIVSVEQVPSQPAKISGDTVVCYGEQLYATKKVVGISYNWQLIDGGTITSQYHTATVKWSSSGEHNLSVTPSNKCGNGVSRFITVDVIEKPVLPDGFAGDTVACVGENNYSVNDIFGVEYNWSINGVNSANERSNTNEITWNDTGTYVLSINMYNDCGDGPILNKIIKSIDIPEQPIIKGNKIVCLGESAYWIDKKEYENYSWSLNAGGILTDLDDSAYVFWDSTGTFLLSATPTNKCGTGLTKSISIEVITVPDQITQIVGDSKVCKGIESYDAELNQKIAYNWTLSGGGTLSQLVNSATINWTKVGNYILTLTPSNQCGNGISTSIPVEVNEIPASPDSIIGLAEVCLGQQTYTIIADEDVNYSWLINGGGTLTSTNSQASVNWIKKGNYTLKVTPSNFCGLGNSQEKIISVKDIPEKPFFEIADTLVCTGQSIYVVNNSTDVNYNWTISGGGKMTTSNNSATVNWNNIGTEIIAVTPSNICGNGPSSSLNIEIKRQPSSAGNIIGDTLNCLGSKLYSVTSVSTIQYKWELTGGGTLSPFSNLAQITWTAPGNYKLKLAPYNECGYGDTSSLNITVRDIPNQPGLIGGNIYSCVGDTNDYQIVGVDGLSYSWAISSNDLMQGSGQQAQVIWSSTGQKTISIKPSNYCGEGPQREVIISVGIIPDQPIFSDGDTISCLGKAQYRITPTSGTNYNWTLSGGGFLSSSNNNCSVNWNSIGSYELAVNGINSCGNSPVAYLTVHVQDVPNAVEEILGDTVTCLGKYIYNNSNIEFSTNYLWTISSGGELNSTNSAVIIDWQVPGTHTLSIVPSNTCGTGLMTSLNVKVKDVPPQPNIIIGENSCCAGNIQNYTISKADGANYRWSLTGGGDLLSSENIATVNWNNKGDHTLIVTPYNICGTGIPRKLVVTIEDKVPQIIGKIVGDTIVCINQELNYSVPYIEGAEFNWEIGGYNDFVHLNSSALVRWFETGNYSISVYPKSSCGEGETITMNIEVEDYLNNLDIKYSGDSLISEGKGEIQWYFNRNIIPFENSNFIKPAEEGDYYVICKNSCNELQSDVIFYTDSLNIGWEIPAYPNPAHDYLLLSLPVNIKFKTIELIERNGKIVKTFTGITQDKIRLDFSDIIPGNYYLRLNSGLKPVLKKIVVL